MFEEWPEVIAKAIDLPRDRNPRELLSLAFAELAVPGGRIEVGYPRGERTVFRTEVAEIDTTSVPRDALPDGAVVLVTGGARGITTEVLHPLARPGVTFILAGRTPLPGVEDAGVAELKTDAALRTHLIAQGRSAGQMPRPREIEQQVQAILRNREISANIASLRATGAEVLYRVTDVRDPPTAAMLVASIYARYGRINGVIHGAGLIEDKRIVDKEADSWMRVVETKALSAYTIAHALKPEGLRFFVLFGSVAGRYGNCGQADYGAANKLLNRFRLAASRAVAANRRSRGPQLGPMAAPARFGHGVDENKRKFAARGVDLVDPEGGALACRNEILYGPIEDVEIVFGEGAWERREVVQSELRTRETETPKPHPSAALRTDSEIRV